MRTLANLLVRGDPETLRTGNAGARLGTKWAFRLLPPLAKISNTRKFDQSMQFAAVFSADRLRLRIYTVY